MPKSLKAYEDEIIDITSQIADYPESDTLKKRLAYRLDKWQKLLDIKVYVANNEKHPWTSSELGMGCAEMPLKSATGYNQVGDYIFAVGADNQSTGRTGGALVVERKETSDLYGTLMRAENRDRFYRELDRFQVDPRFNQMIIMVEGSLKDFYEYSPKFNGKTYNRNHSGANVESRRATIAGLYARGVPVLFCGSRHQAVKIYTQLIRQSIIKNYTNYINNID